MFKLDHIMVESNSPLDAATAICTKFALPFAWPLIEKPEYSSVGVNFGTVNLELIRFSTRFGMVGKSFSGFSGLAYEIKEQEEESIEKLDGLGLRWRIGERSEAHTTITIEEDRIFPTIFLVKYHFDTAGWKNRLKEEFNECSGGVYGIKDLRSVILNQKLPENIEKEFGLTTTEANNRITFTTKNSHQNPIVISDLVENLEIVLA